VRWRAKCASGGMMVTSISRSRRSVESTCRGRRCWLLAKRLAEFKELGYARRITNLARKGLNKTADAGIYTELFQKSALLYV